MESESFLDQDKLGVCALTLMVELKELIGGGR